MTYPLAYSLDTKQLGSTAEWSGATVRTGEGVQSRWSRSDAEVLIARAKAWVMICATANATTCAQQTLRLYRKSSGGKKVTERARKNYLHSPRVGRKAFQYAEYAGDVDEVVDHPILDLMQNPSPWYRGNDFFQLNFMWRELCGNCFVGLIDATEGVPPEGMVPLMPQYTRIQPDVTDFIAGYWYGRATERAVFLEPHEVIHFKHNPSPFDPYNGIGPLYAVLAEADLDAATTTDETARWLNGARPDFVAMLPKGTTQEQSEAFKSRLNSQHRGPNNAGKFLVTTEAVIEPLSWSMKDMEYVASRENIRERILASYGIPESRVKMNDSNLASSLTGDVQYMRDTILPRIVSDAETWTETLLPYFGVEPGEMWFAYDNPVPSDEAATATRNVAYVNAGIITPNEARIDDGRDTSDDPKADLLRDPTAQVGAASPGMGVGVEGEQPEQDEDATPPIAPEERTALQDFVTKLTDGSFPLDAADAFIAATFPWVQPELRAAIVTGATTAKEDADRKAEEEAKQQMEMAAAKQPPPVVKAAPETDTKAQETETGDTPTEEDVDDLMKRAARFFLFINPLIVEELGRQGVSGGTSIQDVLRSVGFEPGLIQALTPALERGFGRGYTFGKGEAESYIADLSEATRGTITPSFDLASPDAQRFLSTYTIRLARSVSATTESVLRATIADGLQEGSSIADLTQRVSAVLTDRTPMEAERIARTESSRAYNRGREAAWKSSGVVDGKEWLLSGNPCPICVTMAEKFNAANAVGLDEPFIPHNGTLQLNNGETFTATYEPIYGPPVHPNCACGMGARFNV